MGTIKRTHIYVDGFNLYYGCLKDTSFKWLDLKSLFRKLLDPVYSIQRIKYFTARVSALGDPTRPQRQQTYIRALEKHISEVKVYYGKFLSHPMYMPLANPDYPERSKEKCCLDPTTGKVICKRIIKTEEKGSDVNIAIHLLNDAWLDTYDCAVLVSNDSDIAGAIDLIKQHDPSKEIGLILPFDRYASNNIPSKELTKRAAFIRQIRKGVLSISQLPDPIPKTNITKPLSW